MALTFGGAISDRVTITDPGNYPLLCTILVWHFPTTQTAFRRIWGQAGVGYIQDVQWVFGDTNSLQLAVDFYDGASYTGGAVAVSSTNISTNTWIFNAFVLNGNSGNPQIFTGTLLAAATEDGYATQTAAPATGQPRGTGDDFLIGNVGTTTAYEGRIAVFARVDRAMTLAEIQQWQFLPRVVADTKLFIHLGFAGTGTQPDWAGNGFSGAVTGATVSSHVPLGPLFGYDLGWYGNVGSRVVPDMWIARDLQRYVKHELVIF